MIHLDSGQLLPSLKPGRGERSLECRALVADVIVSFSVSLAVFRGIEWDCGDGFETVSELIGGVI